MSADVVLGMGGCVDYEVAWDAAVLEALAVEHAITTAELDAPAAGTVVGERDIVLALLAQMRGGHGGERFVEDPTALLTFARRFRSVVSLGGSSVRAAVALDRLAVPSLLHLVSIDDDVRRLLPSSAEYLCSADADSTDPHVIVQYPAGARVRVGEAEVVAPRPNRLILVNDPPNAELRLHPGLGEAIAHAEMIVVSGFNSMPGVDAIRERTRQVREHLDARRREALVVYEDAGFHHDEQRQVVLAELVGAIDIWSMNEDEAQHYLGHELVLLDPEAVAGAVLELHALLGVPTLVIHTRDWALAYGGDADLREALRAGVLTATARFAHGDDWTPEDRDAVGTLPIEADVTEVARRVEQLIGGAIAMVPIPRPRTERPTTIGLGDTFLGGLVAGLVGR
ncbi:ADP-dependent glucokinase/phosphofructokinase [Pseudactinotalea sp.]|uniref:ADP-dependent glucokinase/phosphofructokinase n=1 Tax=Pseudactinotalea sp. TaxID=1926260 RepID=UPI003B3ACE43